MHFNFDESLAMDKFKQTRFFSCVIIAVDSSIYEPFNMCEFWKFAVWKLRPLISDLWPWGCAGMCVLYDCIPGLLRSKLIKSYSSFLTFDQFFLLFQPSYITIRYQLPSYVTIHALSFQVEHGYTTTQNTMPSSFMLDSHSCNVLKWSSLDINSTPWKKV